MNKLEFQQKISASSKPIIIDFWATWCMPCMMTKPILEKLAKEYADKIEFMPINADDSREALEQFRVFGIPTVLTLRDGKEVGRVTGAQNEANYRAMFEALAEGKEVKAILNERYGDNVPLDEIVISPKSMFDSELLITVKDTY